MVRVFQREQDPFSVYSMKDTRETIATQKSTHVIPAHVITEDVPVCLMEHMNVSVNLYTRELSAILKSTHVIPAHVITEDVPVCLMEHMNVSVNLSTRELIVTLK